MASMAIDRLRGATGSVAIKRPCLVATTANITLSGEQTIDGVAVTAAVAPLPAVRVLVKNQTTASENGIYEVSTGAWRRTPDWDGPGDVVTGTQVRVTSGSTGQGNWVLTTPGTITVGTTSVAFDGSSSADSFIQAGAGAVTRTVQDKLRDWVSVLDFDDVDPTGVDDSEPGFSAADAAVDPGTVVYVPAGTYDLGSAPSTTNAAWLISPGAVFTGAGADGGTMSIHRGFWNDVGDGANIWRLADRVFIGGGVDSSGMRTPTAAESWLTTDLANYFERGAQLLTLNTRGAIGGVFASRSSDKTHSDATIGAAFIVSNDAAANNGWASYFEAVRESGAAATYGAEIAGKNKGSDVTGTPYATNGWGVIGHWFAAGADASYGGAPTNPSATAIRIGGNASTWNTGIIIAANGITGTDGITGTGTAIDMARGHIVKWTRPDGGNGALIWSEVDAASSDVRLLFQNGIIRLTGTGSTDILRLHHTASSVNYLNMTNAATGGSPLIDISGTDSNVDGHLRALGTGKWYLSAHDAVTNAITRAGGVRHSTSSTPANGIGVGFEYVVETAADNYEVGAAIDAVCTDVTPGSEDFSLSFKLMVGGAAISELFQMSSTGQFFAPLGSSSLCAYSFIGDPNTGLFSPTGDQISVVAGGATILRGFSTGNAVIGGSDGTRRLNVIVDDAVTNAVTTVARFSHTTTGTAAAGIGVGVELVAETAAGNNEIGAVIEAVARDVTAGSEDFALSFKVMAGGAAAAEKFRVEPTGDPVFLPPATSAALGANGEVTFELTNNTTLTFRARGSDGTTRSGTIALS